MDDASHTGGRAFLHYLSVENTPTDTYSSVFQGTPNSVKLTIKHNHHATLSNDIIIFSQVTREMFNVSTGSKAYKQSSENL